MDLGRKVYFGCFLLLAGVSGCKHDNTAKPRSAPAHPRIVLKAPPPTPIQEKKQELGGTTWQPAWSAVVETNLPPGLLSPAAGRAVHTFCPRFESISQADKRAFWAYTFQAMAGAEAGLDPTASVHHLDPAVNVTDKETGHLSRQQGLLQLKYEDDQRYDCDFDWSRDRHLSLKSPDRTILTPATNLKCGLRIMGNQLIGKHEPLITRRSYWAVLQPGTAGYHVFLKQMANVPTYCGRLERRLAKHHHVSEKVAR